MSGSLDRVWEISGRGVVPRGTKAYGSLSRSGIGTVFMTARDCDLNRLDPRHAARMRFGRRVRVRGRDPGVSA